MRNTITSALWLTIALFGAGCATTTGGLGDETGQVRLPSGLALEGSAEEHCGGTLHVSEDSVAGRAQRDAFFVDPGENATFRLARKNVEWACIRGDDRRFERNSCPEGADYVRFTRAIDGGRVLIECYG